MRQLFQLSITVLLLSWTPCEAYHQGSYFIIDIRSNSESPRIAGRIEVDAENFNHSEPAVKTDEFSQQKRSEFEIDYTTFGAATESSFDSNSFNFSAFNLEETKEAPPKPKNDVSLGE